MREPGPAVDALTDERGAYTLTVFVWTLEALAGSNSIQLMVDIAAPPGLRVRAVTNSLGSPAGGEPPRTFILGSADGPIDITLGPP